MSVDNGAGVAVMSAQKMPAAKMGHTPCYQTNGKNTVSKDRIAHAQLGQDINMTGSNAAPHLQPSRMFPASLTHYSMIRIA
jgi:hypothetical protein